MKNFRNIFILGTSHVADESVKNVNAAAEILSPDIIAVELDSSRLYALKNNAPRPKNMELLKSFGIKGFLFYIIGEFLQKKIGKYVNISPGSEMLAGVNFAEKNKKMLALIDRDIQLTLKRFSKNFKKREALRMVYDMLFEKKVRFDISKVPESETIDLLINHTRSRYPSLFKVLIDERDIHMAKRLYLLNKKFPEKKVLAIVGAGHVNGILRYLNSFEESFK